LKNSFVLLKRISVTGEISKPSSKWFKIYKKNPLFYTFEINLKTLNSNFLKNFQLTLNLVATQFFGFSSRRLTAA